MQRRVAISDPAFAPEGIEHLLCEGGDERIRLDPASGVNRYQCAPSPDPELAAFGSSTASTISQAGFAAAQALAEGLEAELRLRPAAAVYGRRVEALRLELLRLCGLEQRRGLEVMLAPSGTDIHMLVAQLMGARPGRPALAVIGEPAETGSGVPAALAGRSYSPSAPFGIPPAPGEPICGAPGWQIVSVSARADDGGLRSEAAVDAEVEALAARAVAELRRVLLVVTDVSKTGLISPSPAIARELCRRFPGWVDVLVDACQFRLAPSTLGAYVDLGWMIALTGSKFLTGPAFSGALLVPRKLADRLKSRRAPAALKAYSARADWPCGWTAGQGLDEVANFGLLVRWEAALAELRALRAVPDSASRAFLADFGRTARKAIAASPQLELLATREPAREVAPGGGWDEAPSIFPFLMKRPGGGYLSPEQGQRVYALMRQDLSAHASSEPVVEMAARLRVELGQPVACGARRGAPIAALRLCASARLIAEASAGASAAEAVLTRARLAMAKAAWLAAEVSQGGL